MIRLPETGAPLLRRSFLTASAGLLAAPAFAQTPLAAPGAGGQPIIDVGSAQRNPIPIAVTGLGGAAGGVDIGGVITADLARCGLFRPLDAAGAAPPGQPDFNSWKALGAHALVTGAVTGSDPLRVEFRLWGRAPGHPDPGHRLFHLGGQLAPHRPHHRGRGL